MNRAFKTVLILSFISFIFISKSKAQSAFEAGIRYGNEFAIDATIPLSKAPRLHTTFYLEGDFAFGTYFDWLFALDGGPRGLRFFPGVGPEFYFGDDFDLGIAGDFGIEYSFKFPLTIGVDYRPGFMISDGFKGYSNNWGFVARFRFVKAS
jgi:hypothetical protein